MTQDYHLPFTKEADNSNDLVQSIDKIELANQKLSNYLSNDSFTAAEMNKSYDSKHHKN